ncbi:hypothetical protein EGW08_009088, partial [Elysia chlorotica]
GVVANLQVVLLQRGQILPGLDELRLVQPLAHVPVDEGALGEHEVELVVDARPDLSDGGRVAEHDGGASHCGQVSARHGGRRLEVDAHLKPQTDLESRGAPLDKPDGARGLERGDGGIHVCRTHISTVQHSTRHVLAPSRVAAE